MNSDPYTNLSAVGLMSGTSLDGIDAALVSVTGSGKNACVTYRGFRCYPFPDQVRERLLTIAAGDPVLAAEISRMSYLLGKLYARAVIELAQDLDVAIDEIDCVGCHGQTVYHQGQSQEYAGEGVACTLQIGEPAVIAEMTGCAVVSNFRAADIAAGGQGAPLVPYFDYVFLADDILNRAAQNIGGIANVTYLPAGCVIDDIIAFDNGPGNMLIDAAARHFTQGRLNCDLDGQMALAGSVNAALLARLLEHPYYAQLPPKSAGREQFGADYLVGVLQWPEARSLSAEDIVATLTALTAESIAASYNVYLSGCVDEIIISGGGARNPALVEMLAKASGLPVRLFDEFGIPGDAKEAAAFALLATETLRGAPANVPSATGARHFAITGSITLPPVHHCRS